MHGILPYPAIGSKLCSNHVSTGKVKLGLSLGPRPEIVLPPNRRSMLVPTQMHSSITQGTTSAVDLPAITSTLWRQLSASLAPCAHCPVIN